MAQARDELYPSDRIIELAIEKGIQFTIASDAHSHVQLGDNYPRLAEKMAAFGFASPAFSKTTNVLCALFVPNRRYN